MMIRMTSADFDGISNDLPDVKGFVIKSIQKIVPKKIDRKIDFHHEKSIFQFLFRLVNTSTQPHFVNSLLFVTRL